MTWLPLILFAWFFGCHHFPVLQHAQDRISQEKRYHAVLLTGALAGLGYSTYLNLVWRLTAPYVTSASAWLLNAIGINAQSHDRYIIDTAVGKFDIWPQCSGFEGIALMVFALSLVIACDWQRFASWRLRYVYAAGVVVMLIVNVLRIVGIIAAAAWSNNSQEVVDWFHSQVGVLLYLGAIGGFVRWLYWKSKRL